MNFQHFPVDDYSQSDNERIILSVTLTIAYHCFIESSETLNVEQFHFAAIRVHFLILSLSPKTLLIELGFPQTFTGFRQWI